MSTQPTGITAIGLRRVTGILGIVYVLLFFIGNFVTGFGDAAFGLHSPAEVVGWAVQHESTLRLAVFIDLFNDFLSVVLVVLWVALSDRRSVVAPLAYLGLGVSSAVWIVVLGLLYALPDIARLPQGDLLAQAAVAVESTIELSLRPPVLALGLMAAGYMMLRTRSLPVAFGVVLVVLMAAVVIGSPALGTPVWNLNPLAGVVGLKLWIVAMSIVLVVGPVRFTQRAGPHPVESVP